MRQQRVRRAQREVCSQTRPFGGVKIIVKDYGIFFGVKGHTEKPAVATIRTTAGVIEGLRGAIFGVVDGFDCGGVRRLRFQVMLL